MNVAKTAPEAQRPFKHRNSTNYLQSGAVRAEQAYTVKPIVRAPFNFTR